MLAIFHLLGTLVVSLLKSRRRLEVENFFLRHQLNRAQPRARLGIDLFDHLVGALL